MRAIRVRTSSMHSQDAPIEALPIKYLHLPSAAFERACSLQCPIIARTELDLGRKRCAKNSTIGVSTMRTFVATAVAALALGGIALAQAPTQIMTTVPPQSVTVTDWYKQSVYDPANSKIGEIMDVLLSPDGKVNALIVGVGGFLGIGEKDVAVPFSAVKHTTKDGKVYLTLDTTKDALKAAPGLKYDRSTTTWVPENK